MPNRKNPKDDIPEIKMEDALAFKRGMENSPRLEKIKAMLGFGVLNPSVDPNIINHKESGDIRVDMPEQRSEEGNNLDMMKYLPKKSNSMVPNSMQPSVPPQPEVYNAIDSNEEDPKLEARRQALMRLQGM